MRVQVTDYVVCALPEKISEHESSTSWEVHVVYRGNGKWAVTHFGDCYDRDGKRQHESLPSSRTDAFLARYRFDDVDEAIEVAKRVALKINVNGWTAEKILADPQFSAGED